MLKKTCEICKSHFVVANNRPNARFCSVKCKAEWQRNLPDDVRKSISQTLKAKGIRPPSRWKADSTHYSTIHKWLVKTYGKASKCENPECGGRSKNFQWALKKGMQYKRDRSHFIQLCASCHRKYDMTPKTRAQIIRNLNWYGKYTADRVEIH